MKVALLNPPVPSGATFQKEIHRCGDRTHAGELWPPTGLAGLAAVARRAGWSAVVLDGMPGPATPADFATRVTMESPALLVVLTSTPTVRDDLAQAQHLRSLTGAPVVAIGTHVTARPAEALTLGADAVFVGEPDVTLAEVLARGPDPRAWDGIPGVVRSDIPGHGDLRDGGLRDGGPRALLEDLAWLPLPARDLLENHRYTMPFSNGRPFGTVQVARGCPYTCTFCRTPAFAGRQTRLQSVPRVLDELDDLAARGVTDVAFLADTFTVHRGWVERLCDALVTRAAPLRWYCATRVDLVDGPLLTRMARAGCAAVAFGIESASEATLRSAHKDVRGRSVVETARAAVEAARAAGLVTLGYFVLGLPGETAADLAATARFAYSLPLDHAFFHVATPYPGTVLFDDCLARGYLTTTDWRRYEETALPVITTEHLVPEQVLMARWLAQAAFYARPARLRGELARTADLADLWRKARAGVALLRP